MEEYYFDRYIFNFFLLECFIVNYYIGFVFVFNNYFRFIGSGSWLYDGGIFGLNSFFGVMINKVIKEGNEGIERDVRRFCKSLGVKKLVGLEGDRGMEVV